MEAMSLLGLTSEVVGMLGLLQLVISVSVYQLFVVILIGIG
jgi:hypothetical protein